MFPSSRKIVAKKSVLRDSFDVSDAVLKTTKSTIRVVTKVKDIRKNNLKKINLNEKERKKKKERE